MPDVNPLRRATRSPTIGGEWGWGSEERRVGEEGRIRGWPDHLKKKKAENRALPPVVSTCCRAVCLPFVHITLSILMLVPLTSRLRLVFVLDHVRPCCAF